MDNNSDKVSKKIVTLHFGEITVEPQHIFSFATGMLGFDDLKDYVLISEEETFPFKWLISIEQPDIGFPLLSPWLMDLNYNPGSSYKLETQVFFVVVTLEDENGRMTANMKAPVILNTETQSGEQIILPFDKYSTNYVITKS